ncbi:hypothetical protein SAMN05428978_100860 [Nitrosomonas sp. Nm34]|nr:hypothetical protein SAMN05428978_100860 [Nitrosomonas sp. Nm34]
MEVTRIEELVNSRCEELGIDTKELIRRAGYSTYNNGIRRLMELFVGDFKSSRGLIEKLPNALELPEDAIQQAIEQTKQDERDAWEAAWRASFKPHAIVRTDMNGRPRSITMAGLTDAGRHKRIEFTDDIQPEDYIKVALSEYKNRERLINGFFYEPLEIIVNFSPDHASRYTLNGVFLGDLDHAYRNGMSIVEIR